MPRKTEKACHSSPPPSAPVGPAGEIRRRLTSSPAPTEGLIQPAPSILTILGEPFQLFPNGIIIQGKPSLDEYKEAFGRLSLIESATSWWWGDLANAREKDYGSLKQLAEISEKDYNSLHVCQYVCSRYEFVNRFTSLGFKHHMIAAPLDNRLDWLQRAADNEWSARQLKLEILKNQIEPPRFDGTKPVIYKADYSLWLPSQPPCDLLLTDPPYSTEIDDINKFAQTWLPQALAKIKATGRAYIFIGAYPWEIKAYLNALGNQINQSQVLVWEYRNTMGPSPSYDYKMNWQAIIYYKGQEAKPLDCPMLLEQYTVHNFPTPNITDNPYHDRYEKPMELAEMLIRHSTMKGDLVLDCFAGIGTFLMAAAKFGREARGCDIDQEKIDIANILGCQVG